MKKISIALATYNGANYILEQLESLANQTYLPHELIVTDDCSTDNTVEIIKAFGARSPFLVRVVQNEKNIGWKANFMKAASLCASDYIAFCDQDDVWQPEKLKSCISKFDLEDVLLVYHNASVVDENLQTIGVMHQSATAGSINYPQSIEPWKNGYGYTLVIDRILLQFDGYFDLTVDFFHADEKAPHDQWYFFLASCLGIIYYLDEPLVLYRRHNATVTAYTQASTVGKIISSDINVFKSFAIAAQTRHLVMLKIADNFESYNKLATTAAMGYQKLAAYYIQRHRIYVTPNIFSRINQCIKLIYSGAYKSKNNWGVGFKALGRDLIFGVLFHKKLNFKNNK